MSVPSVGFDFIQRLSGDSRDFGMIAVQGFLNQDNYNLGFSFAHGETLHTNYDDLEDEQRAVVQVYSYSKLL